MNPCQHQNNFIKYICKFVGKFQPFQRVCGEESLVTFPRPIRTGTGIFIAITLSAAGPTKSNGSFQEYVSTEITNSPSTSTSYTVTDPEKQWTVSFIELQVTLESI